VSFSSFTGVVVVAAVVPVLPDVEVLVVVVELDPPLVLFFPPHEAASRATLRSTITAATFTTARLRDRAGSGEATCSPGSSDLQGVERQSDCEEEEDAAGPQRGVSNPVAFGVEEHGGPGAGGDHEGDQELRGRRLMHSPSVDARVIIDGHNDLVLRRWRGEQPRHLELADAGASDFAGGFFALYVPSNIAFDEPVPPYAEPLPPPIPTAEARAIAEELAATLEALDVTIARSVDDFQPGRVTAIMHLEGAEPIEPDLSNLHEWYDRGLRSIGFVWSRPNAFAEGVPFRFPSSPDTGPGLTDAGRRLLRACNRLGILVDLSHLNEVGFWDVAALSDAPLVASHSNAHALCASSRNLTDEQLDAIAGSNGVVGVNFAIGFLRADGTGDPATPLSEIVRHIDYLVARMGIDHVAFGSDFDGATVPAELGGVTGLPKLVEALRDCGYDDEAIAKITHGNWLRVLERTWRGWTPYFDHVEDDPRATLLEAMAGFGEPGFAVDLGCGTGRDTRALLAAGWNVLAIDGEQEGIDRLRAAIPDDSGRLKTQVARFQEATWPTADLVNASFALPFCSPERFPEVWERIVASLRPGGRFSGQIFGDRDAWVGTGINVHSREDVLELLAPFDIERLEEIDEEGSTVTGKRKHWHLFHIVARKR
jgi:membrane dipeptidase